MPIRPMKGVSVDEGNSPLIRYPLLASFKYDGIRGLVDDDGVCYSNSGKPLPSKVLQLKSMLLPTGADGEWVYGAPTAANCYNLTQTAVMSVNWPVELEQNKLRFYVFDGYREGVPYKERFEAIRSKLDPVYCPFAIPVELFELASTEEMEALYTASLAEGYEGLVLRSPGAFYKQGRATARENSFWKRKPFGSENFEAEIIGWKPLEENWNEVEADAFGYSKRGSSQDNKVAVEMLGAFHVRDLKTGVTFWIGGGKGLTKDLRSQLYLVGDKLCGRIVKYTSMTYGVKDKPRSPQFRGFRDKIDMTEY